MSAITCPQCEGMEFEKRGEQRTYHPLGPDLSDDSWSTGEITMDTTDEEPYEEIIYCLNCDSEFTESELRKERHGESKRDAGR